MVEQIKTILRDRIEHGATLDELDTIVRMSRGLRPHERAELWLFAWTYAPPEATASPKAA
jgi:hypothetical protein